MSPSVRKTVALQGNGLFYHPFAGEECVAVYDEASGDTHLLSLLAYEICRRLSTSPGAIDTLVETLTRGYPDEDPAQLREAIDAALEQLEAIDLVVCERARLS